ncbi:MAG TPA: hypothetical protein VNR87_05030, partial [Flavisolibacter sp.]|nr:hypothetical protein [Flavisolibacter sp.]
MNHLSAPGIIMGIFSLICVVIFLLVLRKAGYRTGWTTDRQNSFFARAVIIAALWMIVISTLALAGVFRNFSKLPPRPVLMIIIAVVLLLVLSFSKSVTAILQVMPPHWLVLAQSFRIGVEILLYLSFTKKLIPVQMTFEGYNFDIISGLLALPAAWIMATNARASKVTGIAYNIIGLLLLVNVLVIAVLSMPTSLRRFTNEPSLNIVGEFPFILLPGVLVV